MLRHAVSKNLLLIMLRITGYGWIELMCDRPRLWHGGRGDGLGQQDVRREADLDDEHY